MAAKRRASKRATSPREDVDDGWRDSARIAIEDAIGSADGVFLIDSIAGTPRSVVVSLAIAAPPEVAARLRAHPIFEQTIGAMREAFARALPATELVLRLVPPAIDATREMTALALDVAGRGDITDELSLPPSPERDAPKVEPGRSFEMTRLRIRQIEATALRRLRIDEGRALEPDGEPIPHPDAVRPASEAPLEPATHDEQDPEERDRDEGDWFPARSLKHKSAKPRFCLVARLGRVVSVRSGQLMRSLAERRYEHRDEARARADFERRVKDKLSAGWQDYGYGSLERALVDHERLVPEMSRSLLRRSARALLALDEWRFTLAAQALVRTLGASSDVTDRELAGALVARIENHEREV